MPNQQLLHPSKPQTRTIAQRFGIAAVAVRQGEDRPCDYYVRATVKKGLDIHQGALPELV
ncbi:MAG: hypothetical protein ACK5DD_00925 [Cyclobacteriaceae bacterium]